MGEIKFGFPSADGVQDVSALCLQTSFPYAALGSTTRSNSGTIVIVDIFPHGPEVLELVYAQNVSSPRTIRHLAVTFTSHPVRGILFLSARVRSSLRKPNFLFAIGLFR